MPAVTATDPPWPCVNISTKSIMSLSPADIPPTKLARIYRSHGLSGSDGDLQAHYYVDTNNARTRPHLTALLNVASSRSDGIGTTRSRHHVLPLLRCQQIRLLFLEYEVIEAVLAYRVATLWADDEAHAARVELAWAGPVRTAHRTLALEQHSAHRSWLSCRFGPCPKAW